MNPLYLLMETLTGQSTQCIIRTAGNSKRFILYVLLVFLKTLRKLDKWYFNELQGYFIMPLPEIANNKNKPECIFFILKSLLSRNCYKKKVKRFYLQII